jgi:hypothetical protein
VRRLISLPFLRAVLLSAVLWAPASWTTGAQAGAPGSTIESQEQFTCLLPGTAERRRVGIYRAAGPQRCRVDYTRDGKTRSLWSSGHGYQFCVRKALQIVGLLQGVNFKCTLHAPDADDAEQSR